MIVDKLRGLGPAIRSPLHPDWVGFKHEEFEILKAGHRKRSFYGGPDYKCPRCEAVFWFEERVKSESTITLRRVVYNKCCKGGKMGYQLLSEVHNQSRKWTISVLVSHLWFYRGGTDNGPIQHMDLVVLDSQGNHMYV